MPTSASDQWPAPRPRRRGWIVALLLVIAIVSGVAAWRRRVDQAAAAAGEVRAAALDDSLARAPRGTRVIVRVVNASGRRGLGRRATLVLRDYGYDVVDFDGAAGGARATTEIADHTGHAAWAAHLQRALGTGTIIARADSSRYVDLTVLIGRDWQPPTQPFRP